MKERVFIRGGYQLIRLESYMYLFKRLFAATLFHDPTVINCFMMSSFCNLFTACNIYFMLRFVRNNEVVMELAKFCCKQKIGLQCMYGARKPFDASVKFSR